MKTCLKCKKRIPKRYEKSHELWEKSGHAIRELTPERKTLHKQLRQVQHR